MYQQLVFIFDEEDQDVRYRIRAKTSEEAQEDNTTVKIVSALAKKNKITLDKHGFPTSEALEAWHKKHNPHLFNELEE